MTTQVVTGASQKQERKCHMNPIYSPLSPVPSAVPISRTQRQTGSSASSQHATAATAASGASLPHAHLFPSIGRGNIRNIGAASPSTAHGVSGAISAQAPISCTPSPLIEREGKFSLATYHLRCDAIGEPINDLNDQRRLRDLTLSMGQQKQDQSLGYGNRAEDVGGSDKRTLHLMVAGKRVMDSAEHPSAQEDETAHARSIALVGASTASLFKASTCGGGASLLTYVHSDKLAPGENVTQTGLSGMSHEYVEVKASEQEVADAASSGETRHSAIGDPWMKGSAAMLKPHTRHAEYASRDNFSISHKSAQTERQHFIDARRQIQEAFIPQLGEALEDIRSKYHDLPERHPLDGKSLASPDFVQRASLALQTMDPEIRRCKAIVALTKAGVDARLQKKWIDRLISDAMTIHDNET